ncbi:PD-(D/E)XK nuclease family protein [Candidatus Pacearchaeota archaeon]|nr:PD-(D/E)XK nuclease family protein [Candidatus Pacearchaeota archaeon]
MPYKLSPSSLSLIEDCPRCFWLHYNKEKKRPDTIFPSLPSGMDAILKKHFDKFMEKGKLPPELRENKECKDCNLFNDVELLKVWRSNFKGISIKDNEGNILHGAIDNLLTKGKKIIILDYKTRGFPLKEDTHKHYQNQLDFYNYLFRENGYETEDYSFLLFYYPKEVKETGEVIFETKLVKMKIDVKNAENIWKKAIKLLNGPCPRKHEHGECEWCAWEEMEE